MSPEEISQFITSELNRERTQEEITQELLRAGYSENQIDVGFQHAQQAATANTHNVMQKMNGTTKSGSQWNVLTISLGVTATFLVLSVAGVLLHSKINTQSERVSTALLEINTPNTAEPKSTTPSDITSPQQIDVRSGNNSSEVPAATSSTSATTVKDESITKTLSQTEDTVFQFKTGEKVILPAVSGEETVTAKLELRPVENDAIYAASHEINISFDGNTGWFSALDNPEETYSTEEVIKITMPTVLTTKVIDYLFTSNEFENYGERFLVTFTYLSNSNDPLGQLYLAAEYFSDTRELQVEFAAFSIAMMFDDEFLENTDSPDGYPSSVSIQVLTVEPMLGARPQGYKRPGL